MNEQGLKQTHPAVIVAALTVTLFSLAGIGAIFGWIPTHTVAGSAVSAPPVLETAAPPPAAPAQAVSSTADTKTESKIVPIAKKSAAASKRRSEPVPQTPIAAPQAPVVTASGPEPISPPKAEFPPPPPVSRSDFPPVPADFHKKVCIDCGVIESVREIEKPGQASGLGAIGGVVAGGVLGHQVGAGRGRDVMTVLGAIGGGLAGNQIEKSARKTREYQVSIRFEDGSTRVITQDTQPVWRKGDKVKLVGGAIQPDS